MATWNGSYPEDGSNYYINNSINQTPANVTTWDYYLPDSNRTYNSYPVDQSMIFEQNTSDEAAAYYSHANRNVISSPVSNVAMNANYSNNAIQSTVSNKVYSVSKGNFNTINNQLPCFYEDNNTAQHSSTNYNKNNHQSNNSRYKDNYKNYNACDIVQNSNLHATATEFVPNQTKKSYVNNKVSKNDRVRTNNNHQIQETVDQYYPDDVFFEDNKKKFDNKRDAGNRWKDNQSNDQFYTEDRKEFNKNQNYRKYDRYNHNRNFNDKSRNYRLKKDNTESIVTESNTQDGQTVKNYRYNNSNNVEVNDSLENAQKTYTNNARVDRHHHDRKERYNSKDPRDFRDPRDLKDFKDTRDPRDFKDTRDPRSFRDFRDKKNNFTEQNGYGRNNYNKYDRRDNKNLSMENRDKDIVDWRQRSNDAPVKRQYHKKYEPDDAATQRERLTEQLNRGQLECLVCCEKIRQNDHIWSCNNCYHVLHLKCVQKWAVSSQDDSGWRCPACQNVTSSVPEDYKCFCGKVRDPDWNRRDIAHSCGETCGRLRSDSGCVHKCTLLCHPGACPPCSAMVTKNCGCGRTSCTQKCSSGPMLQCDDICDRILNCGQHKCKTKCHHGSCEPCSEIIKQECYCGKHSQEKVCVLDLSLTYSCENVCEKILDCDNHKCKKICHPDDCGPCVLKPETITHCCCGQTILSAKRKSCLDPIPTCDEICSKRLKCGQPNNPHICQANCHEGDCPECELITKVRCRCGFMDKEIPCLELKTKADDARCEKKCIKKRSCGKHKCNQMCCIDIEHICPLPCSKTLSCGKHKCEQTCHKGRCQSCWRSSFEELYCECGSAVIYPPVACGTRKPVCDKPCTRDHPCDHEVLHNCHSNTTCPPCSVLTKKWCYGKHELRKAVPCYVNDVSCGLACGKPITCGRHKCVQICHLGSCEKPEQICVQPCTVLRELCGHNCGAPCHEGKCPVDLPCKKMVKVTCQCGHRTMTRVCAENSRDYQRIASGILASKMADIQLGFSVDLDEVFGQGARKQNQLKTLECNEECKVIERNRRLTLGLQIANPDLSGKLMPRYSDFMKQWGKKDPMFCQMVHDKLADLVQRAKLSKQKSRSYSFEIMNRDKRQFVHETCEHFGCESQAYDQEPKRNVVATAVKDKCWLPSYSLLELLQRENGQRKVPGPLLKSKLNAIDRNKEVLQVKPPPQSTITSEPEIDYFNYVG